jgi:thiamine pyrophosphate-dependent acetolactate synthase large subunit-like protein
MARMNGGIALAKSLRALGVTEVFTLHGGHLDSFLVACPGEGIRLTDTRHEATAGHAAEAYARATGKIGICVITAGPGFANALTPMVDAWLDAVPVVFIAGSPPLREVATNPLQGGFDQVAMAAPVTKWSHRITNVERVPDLIDKAVRTALTGRPGPVFLEVPIDVMFAPTDSGDLVLPTLPQIASRPAPAPEAVDRVLALIADARRPVVIAGGGTLSVRCAENLKSFAELFGVPVAFSSKANGVLPYSHPLNAGSAAGLAVAALMEKQPADLVILLGARAGLFLGGRAGSIIPHSAKFVQIDIDGSEIGRLRTPDVAITADSAEALAAFVAEGRSRDWPRHDDWMTTLKRSAQMPTLAFRDAPKETRAEIIHPFHAARAVAEALSPDTAIAFDGGEAPAWYQPFGRSPGPGLYIGNGYLGCLGVGQGYAIGLARARPGKPVAIIMGDGASGFHIGEFDTMVRHRLPILTIIFNNACWGMSLHGQELVFGKQNLAAVKLAPTDYHKVAEGFGCAGEQITRWDDIAPAVRRAQSADRPACLNIMTDPDIVHPVTPMMVGKLDVENEIPIPYYENIPTRK